MNPWEVLWTGLGWVVVAAVGLAVLLVVIAVALSTVEVVAKHVRLLRRARGRTKEQKPQPGGAASVGSRARKEADV